MKRLVTNLLSLQFDLHVYLDELWINFSFLPFNWRLHISRGNGMLDYTILIYVGPFVFDAQAIDSDLESPFLVGLDDDN